MSHLANVTNFGVLHAIDDTRREEIRVLAASFVAACDAMADEPKQHWGHVGSLTHVASVLVDALVHLHGGTCECAVCCAEEVRS